MGEPEGCLQDFTSISDWELITEQFGNLEEAISATGKFTCSFNDAVITVVKITATRSGPVHMLDHFGFPHPFGATESNGEQPNWKQIIPRVFNMESFYLIQSSLNEGLTPANARLILSSVTIKSFKKPTTVFICHAKGLLGLELGNEGQIVRKFSFDSVNGESFENVSTSSKSKQITIISEPANILSSSILRAIEEKNRRFLWLPWIGTINPIESYRFQFIWPDFRFRPEEFGEENLFESPIMQMHSILKVGEADVIPSSMIGNYLRDFLQSIEVESEGRSKLRDHLSKPSKKEDSTVNIVTLLSYVFTPNEQYPFFKRLCRALGLSALSQIDDKTGDSMIDLKRLARFWMEFVKVLHRYHESLDPLPIEADQQEFSLDLPLLFQRLLVLNYCIKKEIRHMKTYGKSSESRQKSLENKAKSNRFFDNLSQTSVVSAPDSDPLFKGHVGDLEEEIADTSNELPEDDVFFDIPDYEGDGVAADNVASKNDSQSSLKAEGEGQFEAFGTETLLHHPDIPLYIPFTQESGHITLDAIKIQESIIIENEKYEANEDLKIRLQARQLISDMEAFKAANPLGCFEDFVRWYSPKDWNQEAGKLSVRMGDESNLWHRLWKQSKAIPIAKQKLLFDQHWEAERCLFHLEEETVADLLSYILPSVLEIVLDQLQSIRESLSYPMDPVSLTIPSLISIEQAEPLIDTIEGIALRLSVPYYTLLDMPDLPIAILKDLCQHPSRPVLITEDNDRKTVQAYLQGGAHVEVQKETVLRNCDRTAYLLQLDRSQNVAIAIDLNRVDRDIAMAGYSKLKLVLSGFIAGASLETIFYYSGYNKAIEHETKKYSMRAIAEDTTSTKT